MSGFLALAKARLKAVLRTPSGGVYPTAADHSMAPKTRYNTPSHHVGLTFRTPFSGLRTLF